MLSDIIRFSVRFRSVVAAVAVLLLGYGSFRLSQAGLDIFPEFSPKQVIVQTEAPGYSAEQVETTVTQPIENAIAGLIGLDYVRSESIQGLSVVTAIFDEDSDVFRIRTLVAQKIAGLGSSLPDGVASPQTVPLSSSSATVLTIGIQSNRLNLMELRSLVDWTIVPRLMAVDGVADVNIFGGDVKQLQIQLDPDLLKRLDLSIEDVSKATSELVKVRGGGFLENQNQRIGLQVQNPNTAEAIEKIVLKRRQGSNITIGDIAKVEFAPKAPVGAAAIGGNPGIVMMVIGQYGANTLTVSRNVEKAIAELTQVLEKQQIQFYSKLFRPADYILTSVRNLAGHLLIGGLFVIAVLYLFLFNFKTAFISALAIPLSLISAVVVLLEFGINLNIMVLGGLAIALGEVVDDAIIDTENIFRRLRENRCRPNPQNPLQVIFRASKEVRKSVVYASFIVALVFVPLLSLDGVTGRLFAPLATAYILAILMSLLVALTVTPALCGLLLRNESSESAEPPLIRWMKPHYAEVLLKLSSNPRPATLAILLLFILAIAIVPLFEGQFLPQLREGHYIVHTSSVPGTSLQESLRIGRQLTLQIEQIPGVESVSQWAGRAERGADTFGSHYSEYEVRLTPMSGDEQQQVLQGIRTILRRFPGILFEANTFLTERIDETISGYTSPVVVNIYGKNLDLLDGKAREITEIIRTVKGSTDVQLRSPPGTPHLQISMRPDRMTHWGIKPAQIMQAIHTAFNGSTIGNILIDNRPIELALLAKPEIRAQPTTIANLPLRTLDGQWIALNQVVNIEQTSGRYNVQHHNGQRLQTVTANVENRDLTDFTEEITQRILEQVNFPDGFYPEVTGTAVERSNARNTLIIYSILAGSSVLMLIYIALASFRLMIITLINLPFALIGGVFAVAISGATFSVGSMVGFVTLFGITVRNSIMLITHYQHLVSNEGKAWDLDTALLGAQQRLPSILMTALVTALAMLPIAINSDNPGREIMGPMAAIIIGGLFSSTVLNLLMLPIFLLKFGRLEQFSASGQNSFGTD